MQILVLGPGCTKCKRLFEETRKAVVAAELKDEVHKIESIEEIMKYRVMITPALVLDGTVKVAGRVPSVDEIATWLREAAARST